MERLNALNIRERGLVTALFVYDDNFIDRGLRVLTLEQALHIYLLNNGFETIVFYSTSNGFYSFDAEMLGRFLSTSSEAVATPIQDVVIEPSPAGHSTGRRRFTRQRQNQNIGEAMSGSVTVTRQKLNTTPDPYGRFKTRSVGDRNANISEFTYNLREHRHLALVMITSQDDAEFNPAQTNQLGKELDDIEKYGRLSDNDNRLIMVIPAEGCRENIMKCFNNNASIIAGNTFKGRFTITMRIKGATAIETVNPESTAVLTPPTQMDIFRTLESSRIRSLKDGMEKPVDWSHIQDICQQFAIGEQEEDIKRIRLQKLKGISKIMDSKTEYTYEGFKTEGVKKRGNDFNNLNELIGLQEVKDQVQEFINLIELYRSQGKDITHMNKHMVFYGNPGTGKTTVARIVAGILKDLGLVSKGHLIEVTREHLVAGYVGQTAIQTSQVIDSALDGVLFVDEAYRLADGGENDFGREAIETLLARMENDRHRLVVILAGYEKNMERLYNVNDGFKSRILSYLNFQDYSAEELKKIFLLSARKYYSISPETDQILDEVMAYAFNNKKEKFGNGRWVRNLLQAVEGKVAARKRWSDTSTLLPEDFNGLKLEELQGYVPSNEQQKTEQQESGLDRLNAMPGLTLLKKEVKKIVNQALYDQMLKQQGKKSPEGICRHMVFLGNPGTGKTTVARIMADIYFELGILQKRTIVEVDRSNLVAEYLGQTAPKVDQVVNSALGGVLFIDEAYSLVQSDSDSFGREALDKLVKRIEDDKDKLVVILAGYDREMREFIAKNSGLKSRFSTYIHFQDYTPDEMLQILLGFLCERGLDVPSDAKERLSVFINQELPNASSESGNGRWARNLADKLYEAHTSHCVDTNSISSSLGDEEIDAGLDDFLQSQLKD